MDSLNQIDRGDKFRSSVGGSWVELELELVVLRAGRLRVLVMLQEKARSERSRSRAAQVSTTGDSRKSRRQPWPQVESGYGRVLQGNLHCSV
jgi:hypothetical protein